MKTTHKALIFMTLIFFFKIEAQKIDWANAPLNPIALKYKLEHFNLKGDVYGFRYHMFSKSGYLILAKELDNITFLYKNNQLYADSSGRLYEFNAMGYLSKMTYAKVGVQTQNYSYNEKGLLIRVTNTKEYIANYEYDANNRLTKSTIGGSVKEYSYQKNGDELIISEKDFSKTPTQISNLIYKNGHHIGKDNSRYTPSYDKFGNAIFNSEVETLFYSEVENKNNTISVIYRKPTYASYNSLFDCTFYLNDARVSFIFAKVLNRKDLIIYNPFKEQYFILEDALNPNNSGKKQVFTKVYINAPSYLDLSDNSKKVCYKGALLSNSLYLKPNSLKVYTQYNNYLCYDDFIEKTWFCKYNPSDTFSLYPLQEVNSKENLFFMKSNDLVLFGEKGKALVNTDYTHAYNNNDLVLFKNNQPLYYFPNYKNALNETIYPGRLYNKNTDAFTLEKDEATFNISTTAEKHLTSIDTKATTTMPTCMSGNCTNGYGEQKTINNSTIKGFFSNGKPNGFGVEVYNDKSGYYEGSFKDGLREGFGIYTWNSDGQYYIGQWKAGKQHGYGYYKKGTDVFQAGYYENGKQITNLLTQNYIDKQWNGSCIGDCNNGFGYYSYGNGDSYVGFFTNNQRNRIGAYSWSTGNAYIGEFYSNQLTGQASEFYKSVESTYYGAFSNGKRNGLGAYFNKSGALVSKGVWENGILKSEL